MSYIVPHKPMLPVYIEKTPTGTLCTRLMVALARIGWIEASPAGTMVDMHWIPGEHDMCHSVIDPVLCDWCSEEIGKIPASRKASEEAHAMLLAGDPFGAVLVAWDLLLWIHDIDHRALWQEAVHAGEELLRHLGDSFDDLRWDGIPSHAHIDLSPLARRGAEDLTRVHDPHTEKALLARLALAGYRVACEELEALLSGREACAHA
jgi:hypothetical protein